MESSKRHQIAQFIRNNIAPGGRAFISSEIEQAIRKTFGDYLVNVKGGSHPLHVLWEEGGDAQAAVLEQMQKESKSMFDNYQRQEPVDYDSDLTSIYYSLYYLPRNLHKVQFILLDLFERGMLPEMIRVLDIGSAVGTVPLAVADFYNLLKNSCALFDVEETFKPILTSFSCLDASAVNLKNLQNLWANLGVGSDGFGIPETQIVRIGLDERWQQQIPLGPFNLIFASNFLNELTDFDISQRANLVEQFASHLAEDGLIVLIEPADESNAKNLHALQWELVKRGLHIYLPCLGTCVSDVAGGCADCWSWRSETLRMTAISRSLVWSESQQNDEAIKWCYTVIGKIPKAPLSNPLSRLDNLSLGETDLRVQAVSPLIGQKWVKVCGSDGNSGHAVLEVDEHQVITAFTPGDILSLQRVEVSSPARSDLFAGMKRIRISVKSQSFRDENYCETSDVNCLRIDRAEEKEDILRYFLQRLFGFHSFRPGQFEIIMRILAGQDTFGIMATSAGKSLCFQFPAMLLPGISLVVAPLKSLVQDQIYNLRKMGFDNVTRIDSDAESVEDALNRIMEGYYKLVYITPEQLTNERVVAKLREAGKRHGISLFAVDEVHCLSQWGHDFRPAYLNLYRHFREIDPLHDESRNTPIVGLTATASEYVIDDVLTGLHLDRSTLIRYSFDRPELSFEVVSVEQDENRLEKLIQLFDTRLPKVIRQPIWPGIIFVPYTGNDLDQSTEMYQFSAEGLTKVLKEQGYNAAFYHSSMSVSDREQVQENFKKGNIDILVATKGFGMGIDKDGIRFIIHYSMPESPESYYQQAGRAGRGGDHSHCILLYQAPPPKQSENGECKTDYSRQEFFINDKYPGAMEDVQQVWAYLSKYNANSRSYSYPNILYVGPDQILIELNWITPEELAKSKEAATEYEKWRSFEREWNRLLQCIEKGIHSHAGPQLPRIDQIRRVKPSDKPASEDDWKYLLRKMKRPAERNQVRAQLSLLLGQGEMGPRWAASIAERLRSLYKYGQSSKQFGELNKRISRVFNALQRMKFIFFWDTVEIKASLYRSSSWANIENQVADPYVQEFFSQIKKTCSPEKYNSLLSRKEETLELDGLYQDLGMDVLQLHIVLDYLKKRKFLNVTYKDKAYILRLNPDWVTLPDDEQHHRFQTELDLLEQRHQREYDMLNSMQRYIDTTACRRQSIVGYFLQKNQSRVIVRCNFCDNCCPEGITGERAEVEEASRWQLELVQSVQAILEEDLSDQPEPTNSSIERIQQIAAEMHPQENETPIWDIVASMCESHLENRCIGSWRAPFLHMAMEFEQGHLESGLRYFCRMKAHEQLLRRPEQLRQIALIVQNYCPDEYDVVESLYETSSPLAIPEQEQLTYLYRLILIDYDRQPEYLFRIGVNEHKLGRLDAQSHFSDAFRRWLKLGQTSCFKSGIMRLVNEGIILEDMPKWVYEAFEQDIETGFSLLEELVHKKGLEKIVLISIDTAFTLFSTEPHHLQRTAKLARVLGAATLEATCHQNLLSMAELDQTIDRFAAHASLSNLFAEGSSCHDAQAFRHHTREAANLAVDNNTALIYYCQLCKTWSIDELDEEIDWIEKKQRKGWEEVIRCLLVEWQKLHNSREQHLQLLEILTRWMLEGRIYYSKASPVLAGIALAEVVNFPQLLPDWIAGQPNQLTHTLDWIESFITLVTEPEARLKQILVNHVFNSLEISGTCPDTSTSTAFRTYIQGLNYSLINLPAINLEAHQCWLKYCLYWPEFLSQYLELLSKPSENNNKFLVEAIDFVLMSKVFKDNSGLIETIINIFKDKPQYFPPSFLTTSLTKLLIFSPVDYYQQIVETLVMYLSLSQPTRLDYINTLLVCQKMNQEGLEITVREAAHRDKIFVGDTAFLIENDVRLARYYAAGSPKANREKCFFYCLQAAQLDRDLFSEKQLLPYRGFLAPISWKVLQVDLNQIENTTANSYFLPLFLSIWLKNSRAREELDYTCAYIAENNRFLNWQADYTEDVLNMIDIEIVSNYPVLMGFLISGTGKFLDKFKSQSSWALKQAVELHRKGVRFPDAQAREIWESIQVISSDSLADYFEELLNDSSMARSFFQEFVPTGIEISPNACIAFFKLYSVDTICNEFPDLALKMLKSANGKNWENFHNASDWQELKNNFKNLFQSLVMIEQFQKEAYKAWLEICKAWPGETESVSALKIILTNHPENDFLVNAFWACVIEKANIIELDSLKEEFHQRSKKVNTPRIDSGLRFITLLDELGRQSDITMSNSLEGRHFRDIFTVFKPRKDVECADMVVAIIEVMRKYLKPTWLTPMSFYIEALAYSGRKSEADTNAINSPGLQIGVQKIPVCQFLSNLPEIKTRAETYLGDYIKIATTYIGDWSFIAS